MDNNYYHNYDKLMTSYMLAGAKMLLILSPNPSVRLAARSIIARLSPR